MSRLSEQAFNALLLQELVRITPKWRYTSGAERTGVLQNPAKRPDITIRTSGGNTVTLESEFFPANSVERDARDRLGEHFRDSTFQVDTVLALRIPKYLREVVGDVNDSIRSAVFEYCSFTQSMQSTDRWPAKGWLKGDLRQLANCIDLVSVSERKISLGTTTFESIVRRLAAEIELAAVDGVQIGKRIGSTLHQRPGEQTYHMAAAILTNTTIYHDILSRHFDVVTLDEISESNSPDATLIATWRYIITRVNFFPIFRLAIDLMIGLGPSLAARVVRPMVDAARELSKLGITTLYDLSGRMFQKLIIDRKFLATFYTLPSSSTLLAELALAALTIDWNSEKSYRELRVADLACGTGTILSALYRGVLKRYESMGRDSSEIHSDLLAKSVIAADIMPAAVHMAASQLSSFHPQQRLLRSRVYTVPYGKQPESSGRDIALGSLDLLDSTNINSLFETGSIQFPVNLNESIEKELKLEDECLDLVIMNPPFTRPTNHKVTEMAIPSFAGFSTSKDEQVEMSRNLKRFYSGKTQRIGNGNAGLASNFCDLAHLKLRKGGVLALVLPIAALSGEAWSKFRELLTKEYINVSVLTIAARRSKDRSFSADTDMAECLVVARKKPIGESFENSWRHISLKRKPETIVEASEIANAIAQSRNQDLGSIRLGETTVGHMSTGARFDSGLASVQSLELGRFLSQLRSGESIVKVRQSASVNINFVDLSKLGQRGPVDRDIGVTNVNAKNHRGPFEIVRGEFESAMYPTLWWHDHKREKQILILPDSKGELISGREKKANLVWQSASCLHLARDFNTRSASIVASITSEPCLGGRAWPSFHCFDRVWESILALWCNSTMGLMLLWKLGSKQHSGRAVNTISKLPSLLVLDPRKLDVTQLKLGQQKFEQFSTKQLLPASQAQFDENRIELDRFVLQELCGAPKEFIDDFAVVRSQWCQEPIVGG